MSNKSTREKGERAKVKRQEKIMINTYNKIAKIVARQNELRTAIDEIVAGIEGNK